MQEKILIAWTALLKCLICGKEEGLLPHMVSTNIDALRADIVGEVQLAYELEQWVMST